MMVELKRKLGFWQAYATATGLVVAGSTMVTLGNSMGMVGPAFIVSTFLAMVISIIIALSYAELASILPGAGMIGDYTSVAMGKFMSIIAVLSGYFVLVATVGAAETLTASFATQTLWPEINTTLVAIILLTFFLIANLLGVEVFGSIQVVLTLGIMIILSVLGLFGIFDVFTATEPIETTFNPAGWNTVFQSLALGIWLFIGIEFVVPMVEEVKNPNKNIPRAMIYGLLSIFVADMLFGQAIIHYIDPSVLASSGTPQIDGARAMLGGVGGTLMIIVTIFAAASSINSNFAAVPRLFYGLARDGLLPKIFAYLHPKYRTPWVSIIAVYALFSLPLFIITVGESTLNILILSACTTWLISYIIAQLDVIILRNKYKDLKRPFRTPFYPYTQIIGILACLYMIVTIHPDPIIKTQIYTIAGAFIIGICAYAFLWLKYKKQPLFKPVPIEAQRHANDTESSSDEFVLEPEAKSF
ncbi:APC family permease [Gracilibacillus caseinilyticus]|uniref:APC family permease n=1 Tax=Gracilibacillus caseinilyticus TaxID=2932256 RepID=A0ABY4EQA1_9BACI|nr:APC family permease [Gracilibacillus caseinilyticus]UOQ46628.1 APC family permease [Gracilibacillus caseinilyticus]